MNIVILQRLTILFPLRDITHLLPIRFRPLPPYMFLVMHVEFCLLRMGFPVLPMPTPPVLALVLVRYIASFLLVPVVVGAGGVVSSVAVMIVGPASLAGRCAAHDERIYIYGVWDVGFLSSSRDGAMWEGEDRKKWWKRARGCYVPVVLYTKGCLEGLAP